jgi:arsenate reductase
MPTAKFFAYAGCSTCRNAKQWLQSHGLAFDEVPIVEQPPSAAELKRWIAKSGLPVAKWFNTSGQSYRALVARLGKDGVAKLDEGEKIALLAADGKLIKRPVLVSEQRVLVGFDEQAYAALG